MVIKATQKGAVRKTGTKKGATVGSGGNRKRSLTGKKQTPKAEERTYHQAYKKAKVQQIRKKAQQGRKNTEVTEYVLGRNPIVECLRSHIPALALYVVTDTQYDERLNEIVRLVSDRGIPLLEVPKSDLEKMVDNTMHQGVALKIPPFNYCDEHDLLEKSLQEGKLAGYPIVIALDNITDPRNLGAIIRSAYAFGVQGVLIPARRSVGVTAVAWRTSAGSAAKIPVAKATNLTRALQLFAHNGFQIIGLDAKKAMSLDEFVIDTPVVIVVGSEGKGLSQLVQKTCDAIVKIPMRTGAESLNASVAAAIVLAECARQQRCSS